MYYSVCRQQSGENIETFLRGLFELAELCDFGECKETDIRDRLVAGMRDKRVSEELQLKQELTLDDAFEIKHCNEDINAKMAAQSGGMQWSAKECVEAR